jgi:peptidoglycan hydrolase CwlO-like protein
MPHSYRPPPGHATKNRPTKTREEPKMKRMPFPLWLRSALVLSISVFLLNSCREDPKLVKQFEDQKSEITRLKTEIVGFEENLKVLPANATSELDKLLKEAENHMVEIARIEREIAELNSRNRTLTGEFEAYRSKHRIEKP